MNKEKRIELHNKLCSIMSSVSPDYEKHVYFRAPATGAKYPCIMYDLSDEMDTFANNKSYSTQVKWRITIVDSNPESLIPEEFKKQMIFYEFDRLFTTDGLNHFVYTLSF